MQQDRSTLHDNYSLILRVDISSIGGGRAWGIVVPKLTQYTAFVSNSSKNGSTSGKSGTKQQRTKNKLARSSGRERDTTLILVPRSLFGDDELLTSNQLHQEDWDSTKRYKTGFHLVVGTTNKDALASQLKSNRDDVVFRDYADLATAARTEAARVERRKEAIQAERKQKHEDRKVEMTSTAEARNGVPIVPTSSRSTTTSSSVLAEDIPCARLYCDMVFQNPRRPLCFLFRGSDLPQSRPVLRILRDLVGKVQKEWDTRRKRLHDELCRRTSSAFKDERAPIYFCFAGPPRTTPATQVEGTSTRSPSGLNTGLGSCTKSVQESCAREIGLFFDSALEAVVLESDEHGVKVNVQKEEEQNDDKKLNKGDSCPHLPPPGDEVEKKDDITVISKGADVELDQKVSRILSTSNRLFVFGPTGCGKSKLLRDLPKVEVSSLVKGAVGESARAMWELFRQKSNSRSKLVTGDSNPKNLPSSLLTRSDASSVVAIDDIDELFQSHTTGTTTNLWTREVLPDLAACLDSFPNVAFICTGRSADSLPPSLRQRLTSVSLVST
ncbi:unnamed protein product [Amoebophrya sp. A25]|nr:unnamed protein product [Amoebophrya sp. A25]|eukprot:GSA25T00018336001.1